MKKKGALITLLLVCLLVSVPAVAESFGMSNEAALGFTYTETKIAAKEEVTAFASVLFVPAFVSEILATPAIPIPAVAFSYNDCFVADAGSFEADCLSRPLIYTVELQDKKGRCPACAGYT